MARWIAFVLVLAVVTVGAAACGGGESGADRAVSEAQDAAKENPNSPQAWRNLATALHARGSKPEAIQAFNRYLEFRPADTEALRTLGILYVAEGVSKMQKNRASARRLFRSAVATYQKLIRLDPKVPSDQLELGLSAENAGDLSTAVTAYRTYLQLAPRSENARYIKTRVKQLAKQRG
jgi:Flp pilus assembly protein TadD